MRTRFESAESDSEVQMGPLIDCVFLLLIFFLVTATLKKAHKDLEIQLPHSTAAVQTKSKFDTIIIELTRDGLVYVDGDPMTQQLLHKRMRTLAQQNPHRRIRIDADRRTANWHILHLLDICQYEGLNNIGLRARD
jgi:biopolymer transport protein ExbD